MLEIHCDEALLNIRNSFFFKVSVINLGRLYNILQQIGTVK